MYSMNNDNYMINIKFNNIAGILNTKSNEVMFYQFKYSQFCRSYKSTRA